MAQKKTQQTQKSDGATKQASPTTTKASGAAQKSRAEPAKKPAAGGAPRAEGAAPSVPTAQQIAAFVGFEFTPPLKAAQIQRMRRALPGYVNILDDVAELLEEDAAELNLKDLTPAALLDAQAKQKALATREAVLEAAYTSAYHQRLAVDDEAIGMLRAVARRVQSRAEENPELPIRYKALLDFLATFQGGPKAPKPGAQGLGQRGAFAASGGRFHASTDRAAVSSATSRCGPGRGGHLP